MKFSFAFFLFIGNLAFGQFTDSTFIHHTIESEAFGGERKITVSLPSSYLENPEEGMMVTYVLDAQGPKYFNMVVSNMDYLSSRYRIIPTIIVGIHSKDRFKEFTPPAREGSENDWEAGFESHLPNLYDHFAKEVFPLIEANYRTKPFKVIIGHSRGGSFVIQSLFDGHKDLFDGYLAISPALQFDNYQSIDMAKQSLASKQKHHKFLYVSSGDVTETEMLFDGHVNKLDSVIKKHPDETLIYKRHLFQGKDHFTTVLPALNQGLVLLKNEYMVSYENMLAYEKDSSIPISQHVFNFITNKKATNTFYHDPSISYYTRLASDFFEKEDYKNAADIFRIAEKNGKLNKWYDVLNMGHCHRHLGQENLAQECFDRSLILLDDYKEQYGDNFEKIKKNVLEQIAEQGK